MSTQNSELFRVKLHDWGRGALGAAVIAVIVSLGGVITNNFDVFSADWTGISKLAVNAFVFGLFNYIFVTFVSDKEGKMLGKI